MGVYVDVSTEAKIQLFDKGIDRENLGDSLGEFVVWEVPAHPASRRMLIPKLDFGAAAGVCPLRRLRFTGEYSADRRTERIAGCSRTGGRDMLNERGGVAVRVGAG